MSHRNHVEKVIAGAILLIAIVLLASNPQIARAMLDNQPKRTETALKPDPAQNQNPISISAKIDQSKLKPGQTAKLIVSAKIDHGWHIYALTQPPPPRAAKLTIEENPYFKLDGQVRQPKPKVYQDPNFSEPDKPFMSQAFEDAADFIAPIKVLNNAKEGQHKLIAKFSYQACDDQTCLRPTTKTLEIDTTIVAAPVKQTSGLTESPVKNDVIAAAPPESAKAIPAAVVTPSPISALATETASPRPLAGTRGSEAAPTQKLASAATVSAPAVSASKPASVLLSDDNLAKDLKGRGLFGFIWFAVIQGLLALLTPCVFPMIPITVSFFTKRDPKKTGMASVGQAGFFSLGIIFTYAAIGLALAGIAGPTGLTKLASSPWMNLFLTALFVTFALNLFGMFEISAPTGLVSKLDQQAQSGQMGTMLATILMGVTFTLTSFTCTTAFVGTVLIYATQGEWFWAVIGMLGFATSFAFPFFLFALFPRFLSSLPKSGGWLNSVKVVMGFLEIGAAFKFLSNVDLVWGWNTISRNLVLVAWIALSLVAGIYLLGKIQLPHDSPVERIGVSRMLFATSFFSVSLYLLIGLFGAPLGEFDAWLPPEETNGRAAARWRSTATEKIAENVWIEHYDAALQKARAENKPVFLNFTGVTCTNCRWMEKNMFPDPEVKKELSHFVLAELYTDRETPENKVEDDKNAERQTGKFGSAALPLYVIITPDERALAVFPSLTRNKQEFIDFLQRGAARFEQQTALR